MIPRAYLILALASFYIGFAAWAHPVKHPNAAHSASRQH